MIILKSYLLAFCCCFVLFSEIAGAQTKPSFLDEDVEYLWPTNASYYMSSSFAETRSAHFHAALDIGTWGRIGYPIYATRDGIVNRVGVGPRGYGNVIHLKHNDGSYSVYAHLNDFVPEIRSIVDSIRIARDYSFTINEEFEDYGIRFEQGEMIGVSGATGIGPPHLHFELRTPQGFPFNPLLTNLSVADGVPPQFVSLSVEPLGANSVVDGKKNILQKRVNRAGGNNHFGTIPVSGVVGLGVDVFDKSDGVNNVYAVYDLQLKVNGELYFHSRVDSFSYDDTHQMFIDRVYPILRESRKGLQRLYVKNSNRLPFYRDTGYSGVLDLPPGRHQFEIIARDYFGNTSRADGYLLFDEQDKTIFSETVLDARLPSITSNSASSPSLAEWNWNNDWVSPKEPNEDLYITMNAPGSSFNAIQKLQLGYNSRAIDLSGHHSKVITLNENSYLLHRVRPDSKSTFYSSDQRAAVMFLPGSVYDVMSIGLNYHTGKNGLPEIRIYPEHQPINNKAQISFVLDGEQAKMDNLAFYYKHPRNGEYRIVDTNQSGAVLTGYVNHFDTYYVLRDSLGPEISKPHISQNNNGKWVITVNVEDDLSGIDYHASEFYWNDVRGIAEYDPENDQLRYHHPDFEPASHNEIRVIAADGVGNVTYKNFDVRN
ncbi:MAG: M23 family metallopeptidase [Balneolales bacterium]